MCVETALAAATVATGRKPRQVGVLLDFNAPADIVGQDGWYEQVVSSLGDNVYITFDVDVLDPSIMPSTGTPEPGGLGWYEVLGLLKAVIGSRNLVGFDVTELCPNKNNHAPDFLTAKLIYKMLSYKFAGQL